MSSSSKMKAMANPSITVSCAPSRELNEAATPAIASAGIAIARTIHIACITTAMQVVYRLQPSCGSLHSTTCDVSPPIFGLLLYFQLHMMF